MGLKERSAERRKRIEAHPARDFAEADEWDAQCWLAQTPRMRIATMESLRAEWEVILHAKKHARHKFQNAWNERERAPYGRVKCNWMGLKALIRAKSGTGRARDQEDAILLRKALKERWRRNSRLPGHS